MRRTKIANTALGAALVTAALSLAAPAPAAALDRCLAGESTLADERALAAVRADIEAACPCDGFVGRTAYRACARDVLVRALASGAVRRECRATAAADYGSSTCGTASIACGTFTPRARHPVGCRIASRFGCDGGGRLFEQRACRELTHCSDVVRWTAGTCLDVRAEGPFGIGVREIPFTKASAVNPANERVLDTVIWYPAAKGAAPVSPQYRGVFDAPVDLAAGPYPILLFSHGSCGYPLQSTDLLPQLASWGFVVVAPPHPGNTLNEFPDCRTPNAQTASFVERPADVIFVLDRMLELGADAGSPFAGAIDPERIGMSGHSFGGLTTYLVQEREPRIRAALPMAPAALFEPRLTVPSLTLVGAIDSVVDNVATRAAFESSTRPRHWVEIGDAGHYIVSDGCFPTPDCNPPVTRTQPEAHDAARRWILPFLQVYLAGDDRWEAFLAPGSEPPSARYEVVR